MKNGDLVRIIGLEAPYEDLPDGENVGVVVDSYDMVIHDGVSSKMYRVLIGGEAKDFFFSDLENISLGRKLEK